MLVGLEGPTVSLIPGDEADFPVNEAQNLIGAGFAELLADAPVERAVKKPAREKRGK